METPTKTPPSTLEEMTSDALPFNPKGVWKTFLIIFKSSWSDPEALGIAIVSRDRTHFLSAFKYFIGSWGLGFLIIWVVLGLTFGEFSERESASLLDPAALPFIFWPLVFAIPLHFLLGGAHRPNSTVSGFWDGVLKIYQMYIYMLGQFIFFFVPLFLGLSIGDHISNNLGLIFGLGFGLASAVLFLYPMILRTMPGTLAHFYAISRDRALFTVVTLFMVIFPIHSLLTTGHLPE